MKNKSLRGKTGKEWQVLKRELRGRTSISIVELSSLIKKHTSVAVDYALWLLQQDGVLTRSRRGLYFVKGGEEKAFLKNPIEAIHSLFGEAAVFGYGTALYIHGLSRYGLLSEYILISKNDKKVSKIESASVRFVVSPVQKNLGVVKYKYGSSQILITDLERTLIDCIHRPKYAQGWENVVHALNRAKKVNAYRLIEYVKEYGTPSLVSKVGLVLEQFAGKWKIHPNEFDSLLQYLPRQPVKFLRDMNGELNKKWNIYTPGDIFNE
jgi:predicted transcriptional regulator of viral defense system